MCRYQKGKTNLDLLKQETVSGSGISWAICKSAPHSRQITMPAPHHSSFLQTGCPSCCPTNSVKALKALLCLVKSSKLVAVTACGNITVIFTAKRYASVVYAMALCLSVSVTSRSSTKMARHRIMQTIR